MKTYVLIEFNKGTEDVIYIIKSNNITEEKCFSFYDEDMGILGYNGGVYKFYEVEEINSNG